MARCLKEGFFYFGGICQRVDKNIYLAEIFFYSLCYFRNCIAFDIFITLILFDIGRDISWCVIEGVQRINFGESEQRTITEFTRFVEFS